MADNLLLVGDVGATNARYALASPETGTYRDEQVLPCESFDSCEASIQHYLSHAGIDDVQQVMKVWMAQLQLQSQATSHGMLSWPSQSNLEKK